MDSPDSVTSEAAPSAQELHELERRVHALEEQLARLGDPQTLEERVAERVREGLPQVKTVALESAIIEERVRARLAEQAAAAAASAAEHAQDGWARPSLESPPLSRWGGRWSSWLLLDMWREAKLLVAMILDRRYTMAWTTRLIAIVFLPAILTAHWWLPLLFFWFPLMWFEITRGLCVNLVILVLAFALYKALSREAQRYNETVRKR